MTRFDVAIIGAGPGGYVAAIRAAQLGMKVAIVEREHLGGICLNWGCIPTKALLRTSELYTAMRRASEFGLAADNVRFDLARVVERSRKVAERLSNGVAYLMRKNAIKVIDGTARLQGGGRIAVTGKGGETLPDIEAEHIIVATGARARVAPGLEPDGRLIWTYKEAMIPAKFPKSLLIVGSGAIGIEFASFYRSLGAEVTVVEMLPRILPAEDEEISELARKAFARQGIAIHTGTRVERLTKGEDSRDRDAAPRRWRGQGHHRRARDPRHRHYRQCRRDRTRTAGGARSTTAISWSTTIAAPACPAFTPSATWSARLGSRIKQATRASSASRPSPASRASTRSTAPPSPAAPIVPRKWRASVSPKRKRAKQATN